MSQHLDLTCKKLKNTQDELRMSLETIAKLEEKFEERLTVLEKRVDKEKKEKGFFSWLSSS